MVTISDQINRRTNEWDNSTAYKITPSTKLSGDEAIKSGLQHKAFNHQGG